MLRRPIEKLLLGAAAVVMLGRETLAQSSTTPPAYSVQTIIGGVRPVTGAATDAAIAPDAIAADRTGNLYVVEGRFNRILRVNPSGVVSVFAGTGIRGFSGDGGPATGANFNTPLAAAAAGDGSLYIADSFNSRIRKVSAQGIVSTVVGNGRAAFSGDGGPADKASISLVTGLGVAPNGDLIILDAHRVRRVDAAGQIATIAGTGVAGFNTESGVGTAVQLDTPSGNVAFDASGNMVFADSGNERVRRLNLAGGTIATIAGRPDGDFVDGGPAIRTRLFGPNAVAYDAAGVLLIADGNRLRQVKADGIISNVAGQIVSGFAGDNGPIAGASFSSVQGIALIGTAVFLADTANFRVRRLASGVTATVAGRDHGDGLTGRAADAIFLSPSRLAFDRNRNLYVVDRGHSRVRKISPDGTISVFAGRGHTGGAGPLGDGGPAVNAQLFDPIGIAFDSQGNAFIADRGAERIRRVDPRGVITTVAGSSDFGGFGGDGGAATAAKLHDPTGVGVDEADNLYIADEINGRVRRVNAQGIIETVAGGSNNPERLFDMSDPVVDKSGNLYVISLGRIRKVTPAGVVSSLGGISLVFTGPLVLDATGNLVATYGSDLLHITLPQGFPNRIAGSGVTGFAGDGGLAIAARFDQPDGIAIDSDGSIVIADSGNHRLRRLTPLRLSTVEAASGIEQSGPAGSTLPVRVKAVSTTGIPLSGVAVRFSTEPNGVILSAQAVTTGADGLAAVTATLGRPGVSPVTATVEGVEPIRFTLVSTALEGFPEAALRIAPFAGDSGLGEGIPASAARLNDPVAIAVDREGNTFIADRGQHRVRKIAADGTITTVAGTGIAGLSGDGGRATEAMLNTPGGVAVGADGTVYIADGPNYRVRCVAPDGIIRTCIGSRGIGFSGDGGQAAQAQVSLVYGLAFDAEGRLLIADSGNGRIRRVGTDGIINTVAGSEGPEVTRGDGGPAIEAGFSNLNHVAAGADGAIYASDFLGHRVRKIDASGIITTLSGTGVAGSAGGDGPAAAAQLNLPWGVAVAQDGTVYVADAGNGRILKISPDGSITTAYALTGGGFLAGLALDSSQSLIFTNSDGRSVARLTADGIKVLVGFEAFSGDGGPASAAHFSNPQGIVADSVGNVFISDQANGRVRKVSTSGTITTVAGTGVRRYFGDGGPALSAGLVGPAGLADYQGNLFIADLGARRVRKVSPDGIVTTVAGSGADGFSGDDGPATAAAITPFGLAVDGGGNLFIRDLARIRKVSPDGIIRTIAGNGEFGGFQPDGLISLSGPLYAGGIAADAEGNLYLAEPLNHRIRKLDPSGVLSTVAGTGQAGFSGDYRQATVARLAGPEGIAIGPDGNLYIADTDNHRIRVVFPHGGILTVAGNGEPRYGPDGDSALQTPIYQPSVITVDPSGRIYLLDSTNHRVRLIDSTR